MQPQLLDLGAPVGVELGCALRRDVRLELVEIVAERRRAAGDGDAVSRR